MGPASSTPWEPPGTIFVTQVFDELCKRVSTELDRKLSTQTSCWEVVRSAEWTRFDKLVNTAKKNIWGAGKSLKVSQNQVHNWAVALSCLDIEAVQFIKTVLECIRHMSAGETFVMNILACFIDVCMIFSLLREGPSPRGAPSVPPFSPSFS